MQKVIYIVASLPRTGTTSLCEMAKLCGLKSLHVLKHTSLLDAIDAGYCFFADTPFYSPEFLIGLLEATNRNEYCIKFIYSHRDFDSHKKSLNKLLKAWQPPSVLDLHKRINLLDHLCYNNLSDKLIVNHYEYILKISKLYNISLLDYNFVNGWKTFCEFIECKIPENPIPKIDCLS